MNQIHTAHRKVNLFFAVNFAIGEESSSIQPFRKNPR
jgi:hypothetical protein